MWQPDRGSQQRQHQLQPGHERTRANKPCVPWRLFAGCCRSPSCLGRSVVDELQDCEICSANAESGVDENYEISVNAAQFSPQPSQPRQGSLPLFPVPFWGSYFYRDECGQGVSMSKQVNCVPPQRQRRREREITRRTNEFEQVGGFLRWSGGEAVEHNDRVPCSVLLCSESGHYRRGFCYFSYFLSSCG